MFYKIHKMLFFEYGYFYCLVFFCVVIANLLLMMLLYGCADLYFLELYLVCNEKCVKLPIRQFLSSTYLCIA